MELILYTQFDQTTFCSPGARAIFFLRTEIPPATAEAATARITPYRVYCTYVLSEEVFELPVVTATVLAPWGVRVISFVIGCEAVTPNVFLYVIIRSRVALDVVFDGVKVAEAVNAIGEFGSISPM